MPWPIGCDSTSTRTLNGCFCTTNSSGRSESPATEGGWNDRFESDELNHSMNVVLGIVEALTGAVLITMGLRQLDFADSAGGEELRRIARRTAGEAVKTLLGHFLRVVGIVRDT